MGPTVNRQGANYNTPHDAEGPLHLQDHSNPVRYRNIWMRRLLGYDLKKILNLPSVFIITRTKYKVPQRGSYTEISMFVSMVMA